MSYAFSIYMVIAALLQTEMFLGPNRTWQSHNDAQATFVSQYFNPGRGDVANFSEVKSIASYNHNEINMFLKKHGFDIKLRRFERGGFGAASLFALPIEWQEAGENDEIEVGGKKYPAVKLERNFRVYNLPGSDSKLIMLETKSEKDFVYMAMLDETPPRDGLQITEMAQGFMSHRELSFLDYDALYFPKVDLNYQEEMTWLLKLSTMGKDGQPAFITQALQQSKLKMNEKGALAESAVAVGVTRGMSRDIVFDRPFLLWFQREGIKFPLFVAYVDKDSWKDPGKF